MKPTTTITATFTASLKSHYYGWKKVYSASADNRTAFAEKFDAYALDYASTIGNSTRSLDGSDVREEIKRILDDDGDLSLAKTILEALIDDEEGHFAILDDSRSDEEFRVFDSEDEMQTAMDAHLIEIAYRELYEAEGNHQGRTRSLEVDAWVTVRLGNHEFIAKFKEEMDDIPNFTADEIDCDEATEAEREAMAEALNDAINSLAD